MFTVPDDDRTGDGRFVLSRARARSRSSASQVPELRGAFYHIGHGLACYNEIASCTFDTRFRFDYSARLYHGLESAPTQADGSTHNWFHHCVFTEYGKHRTGEFRDRNLRQRQRHDPHQQQTTTTTTAHNT
ncbi:MAG: hypothetical protein M0C28_27755 [Candidatus Moduliflexus flocculans]|nr:hypothetical protein [Candidatus Moduliflexus flocculans]